MTTATSERAPASAWRELLVLARREAGDRAYLARLLELWRRDHGAEAAALYLRRDGGFRRELVAGEGAFPEHVDHEEPDGFRALPLPAGLVLALPANGGERPSEDDPWSVLLAAAVKARRLQSQLKEQHFQVNYRGVELEALYDVGLAVASTLDLDRLAEEVLLRAVSLLDARRGALYLLDDGNYRLDGTFGGEAAESFPVDAPGLEEWLDGSGDGPPGLVPGAEHLLTVPIESDGRRRGLLLVGDKETRHGIRAFPGGDRRTLSLFANQAAIALENAHLHRQALEKERLEREMELAAEIQRQILPDRLPEVDGWDVFGWNRPARQVGGDYYDVVELEGGRLGVALGDVTGKGMPASLLVSTLHSALTLLRDRGELGPGLVERLNRHICDSSSSNKFITLVVAEIDPATARLTYVNAGHNPGFLVRAGGEVERLGASGLPVGLMRAGSWRSATEQLAPGDLVCLYSDGITEAAAADEEEFGEQRLVELLVEHRGEPLAEVVAIVEQAVSDFSRGHPQGDDQTVVLVRRWA